MNSTLTQFKISKNNPFKIFENLLIKIILPLIFFSTLVKRLKAKHKNATAGTIRPEAAG